MEHSETPRRRDYLLAALLVVLLSGSFLLSGKPLTMHEARLPQTSLEMMASGEWLLPHSGERPWLERPPFPHWVTIVVGHIFGNLDREWIVRIPPVMMSLITLVLVGWMATRLFGAETGLLASLALATMYEFYFYSGQAEDDIFLAALVAACFTLFVAAEFPASGVDTDRRTSFLGNRPIAVWGFFAVLGLTSLAKGPLMGAMQVGVVTGCFLLLMWDRERILRYTWLWGWLLFAVVTMTWPLLAYWKYPSVWDNWVYDYMGPFGKEPVWYYAVTLLWATAPWTPAVLLGLGATGKQVWTDRSSTHRFLWCWAFAPIVLMSAMARKHHHYLVPVLAGWGVLAAFGIIEARRWLFGGRIRPNRVKWVTLLVGLFGLAALGTAVALGKVPGPPWMIVGLGVVWLGCTGLMAAGLLHRSGRLILAAVLVGMVIFSAWGQSVLAIARGRGMQDVEFLHQVQGLVPPGKLLMIDASDTLEFFRNQFYSRRDAVLLHNITFLRDIRITEPEVYVFCRYRERKFLAEELGTFEIVAQSVRSSGEKSPEDRWTLFRLHFKPGLMRYPAPKVSVLQAMGRATGDQAGPYCGPPPPNP